MREYERSHTCLPAGRECTEKDRDSLCSQEKHSLKSMTRRVIMSSVYVIESRASCVITCSASGGAFTENVFCSVRGGCEETGLERSQRGRSKNAS
jgi:hypothetical protein